MLRRKSSARLRRQLVCEGSTSGSGAFSPERRGRFHWGTGIMGIDVSGAQARKSKMRRRRHC